MEDTRLPKGHPPFARQAKGTPPGALPFGRNLCDNMAAILAGAGADARRRIERLAMTGLDRLGRSTDIYVGGTMFHVFRDVVGPEPLSIRFGIKAVPVGEQILRVSYSCGVLKLDRGLPESVLLALRGRRLGDVVDIAGPFPGLDRPIRSAEQSSYRYEISGRTGTIATLLLRVPHRQAFLTYDEIEHGLAPVAVAA